MGNFYTNITLKTSDREEVIEYMRVHGRACFVSPTSRGFTTVYDRIADEQDLRDLENLALDLSSRFQCIALAVLNHDDDILWLALAGNGNWLTQYQSDQILSGSAWRLASAFNVPGLLPLIWVSMRWPIILFQIWRHSLIAWALGIPGSSVGFGYRYLSRGEHPSANDITEFEKI
jgi:hypothetical protein